MTVLGQFQLHEVLGVGGMGEVRRATHLRAGTAAAVKVLTSERARDPRFIEVFRREARYVAGLSHPAIVPVYDYGEARGVAGVPEGSPWLAMALAPETLHERVGRLSWPELRAVLETLLDALGHVHAHGLVHLDLKPSNVLMGAGPLLADFGVSRWSEDDRAPVGVTGTRAFMPPEQRDGRWRDFGPWTDLYALGAMAWALWVGSPPRGWSGEHGEGMLPSVPGVPASFRAWVARLTEADPGRRFGRAAEALAALLAIEAADWGRRTADDQEAPGTEALSSWLPETEMPQATPVLALVSEPALVEHRPVRVPPDWRAGESAYTPPLFGAGLGLYGLRALPLVGREGERDRVWAALGSAVTFGVVQAVIVQGEAGVGKSRLAEWLTRRAFALGCEVLVARHGDPPGARDGLGPMIERHLVAFGLDRAGVAERVRRAGVAEPVRVAGITELVRPRSNQERRLVGEPERWTPPELADAARFYVEHVATRRPVVLWLDDAVWGPDATALAAALVGLPSPVLILLTVRAEARPSRPAESKALDALVARRIVLAGLEEAERKELVQSLLGLSGDLAAKVEERSAGNPLFAVQLVGDWVQRGVLKLGEGGFDVVPGADAALPDAIHTLWMRRIAELLSTRPEDDRVALELAAVLGVHVDLHEWRKACENAQVPLPSDLADALRDRGLAVERESGGWAFSHGLLAESLVRAARDEGRLSTLVRHAGMALTAVGAEVERRALMRQAIRVLTRAIQLLADDLEALCEAAYLLYFVRSQRLGEDCRPLVEAMLVRLEGTDHVRVRGRLHHLAASIGFTLGAERTYVTDHLAIARSCALQAGNQLGLVTIVSLMARLEKSYGKFTEAAALQASNSEAYATLGAYRLEATSALTVAICHTEMGHLDEAEAWVGRARALYQDQGDKSGETYALWILSAILLLRFEHEAGIRLLDACARQFEEMGMMNELSEALTEGVNAALRSGDTPGAVRRAERALWAGEQTGNPKLLVLPRLCRGLVHLHQGDIEGARALLETAWIDSDANSQRLPHLRLLCALGLVLHHQGLAAEATQRAEEARALGESVEGPSYGANLRALLAVVSHTGGETSSTHEHVSYALLHHRHLDVPFAEAVLRLADRHQMRAREELRAIAVRHGVELGDVHAEASRRQPSREAR